MMALEVYLSYLVAALVVIASPGPDSLNSLAIGLARGKKQHDKRDAEKERDWKREQQRLLRSRRG